MTVFLSRSIYCFKSISPPYPLFSTVACWPCVSQVSPIFSVSRPDRDLPVSQTRSNFPSLSRFQQLVPALTPDRPSVWLLIGRHYARLLLRVKPCGAITSGRHQSRHRSLTTASLSVTGCSWCRGWHFASAWDTGGVIERYYRTPRADTFRATDDTLTQTIHSLTNWQGTWHFDVWEDHTFTTSYIDLTVHLLFDLLVSLQCLFYCICHLTNRSFFPPFHDHLLPLQCENSSWMLSLFSSLDWTLSHLALYFGWLFSFDLFSTAFLSYNLTICTFFISSCHPLPSSAISTRTSSSSHLYIFTVFVLPFSSLIT